MAKNKVMFLVEVDESPTWDAKDLEAYIDDAVTGWQGSYPPDEFVWPDGAQEVRVRHATPSRLAKALEKSAKLIIKRAKAELKR